MEGSWAAGILPGIFTMPIGLLLAIQTVIWRSQAKRLAAVGVDAIAEVLTATIRPGGETNDTAELTIRLSGPTFETFEASCELGVRGRSYEVGDRLDAVVDPSDKTFAIFD